MSKLVHNHGPVFREPRPRPKRHVVTDTKPERVPISTPTVKRDRITLAKLKFMGQ